MPPPSVIISYNNSKYTLFILHPILSRFPFNHLSLTKEEKGTYKYGSKKSYYKDGRILFLQKKKKRTKCTHKISFWWFANYFSSPFVEFSRLNLSSSSAMTAGSCFFLCLDSVVVVMDPILSKATCIVYVCYER